MSTDNTHLSKGPELDVVLQSIADAIRACLDYGEEKNVRELCIDISFCDLK